jgi:hypothetical protein
MPKLRKSPITIVFQCRVFSVLDSILSLRPGSNTCGDNSGIHENPSFPPLSNKLGLAMAWKWIRMSRISDGVLVQNQNCTSRCLKLHASVSQYFGTECAHSHVPGLKAGGSPFFETFKFFWCICRS